MFERFENRRTGYKRGGAKVFATLTGNSKAPILLVGRYLVDAGFDPKRRYVYLWDAGQSLLGLEPNDATGFKVMRTMHRAGNSFTYSIQARGFCAWFKIRERFEAVTFKTVGETWILKMKKVE